MDQLLDRKGGLLELSSLQPVAKKQRNKELLPLKTLGGLKLVAEWMVPIEIITEPGNGLPENVSRLSL